MPFKSKSVVLGAAGVQTEVASVGTDASFVLSIMVGSPNQTQWFYGYSVVAYIDRTSQKIYVINYDNDIANRTAYVFYM